MNSTYGGLSNFKAYAEQRDNNSVTGGTKYRTPMKAMIPTMAQSPLLQQASLNIRIMEARRQNIIAKQKLGINLISRESDSDVSQQYSNIHSDSDSSSGVANGNNVSHSNRNNHLKSVANAIKFSNINDGRKSSLAAVQQKTPRFEADDSNDASDEVEYEQDEYLNNNNSNNNNTDDGDNRYNDNNSYDDSNNTQRNKQTLIKSAGELQRLAQQITSYVSDNTRQEYNENSAILKKEEEKSKFRSYIHSNKYMVKKPMWRHYLNNDKYPAPNTILKGKRLWISIAYGIIIVYLRPMIALKKRQEAHKSKELASLKKTIILYADLLGTWLCSSVNLRIPLTSMQRDKTLDFNLTDISNQLMHKRLTQIKVRVLSLVQALTEIEMPKGGILDFLSEYIKEGNYFEDKYLFPYEKTFLDFNQLDATRYMLKVVSNDSVVSPTIMTIQDMLVDVNRAKFLLTSLILVRHIVSNILLTPWNSNLCQKPLNRQCVYNYRVVASIVYEVVRLVEPRIPMIKLIKDTPSTGVESVRESPEVASNSIMSKIIRFVINDKSEGENDALTQILLQDKVIDHKKLVSIGEIHSLLLTQDAHFDEARPYMADWLSECAESLGGWMDRVARTVIEYHLEKYMQVYVRKDEVVGDERPTARRESLTGRRYSSFNANGPRRHSVVPMVVPSLNLSSVS